jgi:lipopolysaccharide transport system permease protein
MNDADTDDGRPVKVIRPTLSTAEFLSVGLADLLRHRGLFAEMTVLRLKVRYRQSLLGWSWAILPPLLLMVTYTLIFSKVIGLRTGDLPYALFIFAGLIPWTFFATSVSTATAGIVTHRYLISRVAFPREIIPLSYVAAALTDFGVGAVMLAAMMRYFGYSATFHALYAIPVVAIIVVFTIAATLCFSSFQARFRDIGIGMPLLLQVLMFAAPVVYSSTAIPVSVKAVYFGNPLAILIDAFRQSVVVGITPDVIELAYCAVVSVLFLTLSYVLFKRLDATLADVL